MSNRQRRGGRLGTIEPKTKTSSEKLTVESDEEMEVSTSEPNQSRTTSSRLRICKPSSSIHPQTSSLPESNSSSIDANRKETESSKNETCKEKKANKLKLSRSRKPKFDIGEIFSSAASLDQTSDFSSGFTPYKALAQKTLNRSRKGKTALKTSLISSKEDEDRPESGRVKPSCDNLQKKSSQVKETHRKTATTTKETIATQKINEDNKLIQLPIENVEKDNERPNLKDCNICGEEIDQKDTEHIKKCLHNRFNFKQGEPGSNTRSPERQKKHDKRKPSEEQYIYCQVCQTDMTALTADDRTAHVNACIDGTLSAGSAGRAGRAETGGRAETSGRGATAARGASPQRANEDACHICQRDLSELNSHRRSQHVNFCVDRTEKQKKEQEAALKKAQQKVLDCPLCGKPLQTQNSRRTHLKQCARALDVSVGLLQERVRQQEEEYKLQLAAGVLPAPAPSTTRANRPKNSRKKQSRNDGPELTTPQTHVDADTALAIALSSSLAEHQRTTAGGGAPPGVADVKHDAADAFKLLMTPKETKTKRRGRKNKAPDRVPELLLQSREDLQQHLAARIELLFAQSSNREITSTPPWKTRATTRRPLKELNYEVIKEAPWWTLTTLAAVGDASQDKENKQMFYVQQLMPPITVAIPRQKPKPLPKHNVTSLNSQNTSRPSGDSQGGLQVERSVKDTPSSNETLVASTQTAVYLAELAAESGNLTVNLTACDSVLDQTLGAIQQAKSTPDTPGAAAGLNTTGFVMPDTREDEGVLHSTERDLLDQLRAMVDNPVTSDLQIVARDGSVAAHKFMFATRCPKLFKDFGSTNVIKVPDYETDTVKAVLTFIYTGTVNHVTAQVASLASRWQLGVLPNLCKARLKQADVELEGVDADTSQSKLDEIVKNIWGSDYEESDSEDERDKILEPNEKEMDEACDFLLTQRRNAQQDGDGEEKNSDSDEGKQEDEDSNCSFDKLNMTAADVLCELAKMDQDSTESSGDDEQAGQAFDDVKSSSKPSNENPETRVGWVSDQEYQNGDKIKDQAETVDLCVQSPCQESSAIYNTTKTDQEPGEEIGKQQCPAVISNVSNKQVSAKYDHLQTDCQGTANHLNPQLIDSDSSEAADRWSPLKTSQVKLPEEDDKLDLILNPVTADSDDDSNLHSEGSEHEKDTIKKSPEPEASQRAVVERSSLVSVHDDSSDDCRETSMPDLFAGSPQTPLEFGDSSDVDLFEVCGESSEDDEQGTPIIGSPVFRNRTMNKAAKDLSAIFSSQGQARSARNEEIDNDSPVNTQDSTANSERKRKRSVSVSPAGEGTSSQHQKKPRVHSSSDEDPGSPTFTQRTSRISSRQRVAQIIDPESSEGSSPPPSPCPVSAWKDKEGAGGTWRDKKGAGDVPEQYLISSDSDLDAGSISDLPDLPNDDLDAAPRGRPESAPGVDADPDTIDLTLEEEDLGPGLPVAQREGSSSSVSLSLSDCEVTAATKHDLSPSASPSVSNSPGGAVPDVWSDFDDAGFTEEFVMPATQPTQNSHPGRSQKPAGRTVVSESASEPDPGPCPAPPLDYDPPTDMDTDISMLEDDPTPSFTADEGALRTPQVSKVKGRRRPAVPPSPFTPMADYDNMKTPAIKKACQEFGVRPMPKKRMIKFLKSTYNDLHQYETDSELEQSFEAPRPSTSSAGPGPSGDDVTGNQGRDRKSDDVNSSRGHAQRRGGGRGGRGRKKANEESSRVVKEKKNKRSTDDVEGADSTESVSSSQPTCSQSSQQAEGSVDLAEGSFFGTQSDPTSSPEKSPKSKRSSVEFKREKIRSHILGNDDLYLKILQYEPLEFEEFRQELKDLGVTIGSTILMDFLDEHSVQFTKRKSKEEKEKKKEERGSRRGIGRGFGRGRGRGRRPGNTQASPPPSQSLTQSNG